MLDEARRFLSLPKQHRAAKPERPPVPTGSPDGAGGSVTAIDGAPLLYGNAERGFENPDFVAWGRGPLTKVREG